MSQNCPSRKKCRECNGNHHTIIHQYFCASSNTSCSENEKIDEPKQDTMKSEEKKSEEKKPDDESATKEEPKKTVISIHAAFNNPDSKYVVLATASVPVEDKNGRPQLCRVLLDSCSQSCLITENCAQALGLKRSNLNVRISGLNQEKTPVTHGVKAKVMSRFNKFEETIDCLVVPTITGQTPSQKLDIPDLITNNEKLADPEFHVPGKIDMLIGGEYFFSLLKDGFIPIFNKQLYLQNTVFGWTVVGKMENPTHNETAIHMLAINCFLNTQEIDQNQPLIVKEKPHQSVAKIQPSNPPEQSDIVRSMLRFSSEPVKSSSESNNGFTLATLPCIKNNDRDKYCFDPTIATRQDLPDYKANRFIKSSPTTHQFACIQRVDPKHGKWKLSLISSTAKKPKCIISSPPSMLNVIKN